MAKFINMPKMGNTVEEVIFSEWHVKEGDVVKKGDKFFSYETDKTTAEETSLEEGVILKLLVKDNDDVKVHTPIAIIGKKGEDFKALLKKFESSKVKEVKKPKTKEVKKIVITKLPGAIESPTTNKPKLESNSNSRNNSGSGISPRALRSLKRSGISPNSISYSSGPRGRTVVGDIAKSKTRLNLLSSSEVKGPHLIKIEEMVKLANSSQGDEEFKYTPMRSAISKSMIKSQNQSAFNTLSIVVDSNQILEARAEIKKQIQHGGHNISINDLLMFALSRVLPKYKNTINAHVEDNKAIGHAHVNLAVAVDTPIGLMVPVIKEANLKSIEDISEESKANIKSVISGKLNEVDLKSGTFTISNVGAMNIEMFTPVLNDGQAGILGVGTSVIRPRKSKTGMIEFYSAMTLSLTTDHRLVDGADAARFLNDLKLVLENISLIL